MASKNNFWGVVHTPAGVLRRGTSAGGVGLEGSRKGKLQAATRVAEETARALPPGELRRRGPPRVRRRRRKYRFRARPPRWSWRGRLGRRHPVRGVTLVLAGWTRDRRWRFAWAGLTGVLGGRVRLSLVVRPVRPHNGLRPRKARRK